MIATAWNVKDVSAIAAPTVALLVAALTLWINGDRAQRQRRRDLHARGLAVAIAYAEMPFAIRRRRYEIVVRSEERVRISTRFSEIQAEMAVCQALIDADGIAAVSLAYRELVAVTRTVAGAAAKQGWLESPIRDDREMPSPEIATRLVPVREQHEAFAAAMGHASRSPWRRVKDWFREQ